MSSQSCNLIYGTMRLTNWGANFGVEETTAVLRRCLELGITTLDTADIYGDYSVEALLGEVFAKNADLRAKFQIITKCGIRMVSPARPEHKTKQYDAGEAHILASVNTSLKAMQTDYIDLLLIHRPDPFTHPAETAKAFKVLQDNGKVRAFGVSNYTPAQLEALAAACESQGVKLSTNQVQVSLFHTECLFDGTLDQCMRLGITPQAWSPFGGGKLWQKDASEETLRIRNAVQKVAEAHGNVGLDAVALAWVAQHPAGTKPIIGSTNVDRIESATKSTGVKLTRQEWFFLLEAARGHEVA